VGDHGQLEPIGKDEGLMQNPDYVLEEIHRNAGEIAHFAEFIRKGFRPAAFKNKSPKNIHFINKKEASKLYLEVDQIICAFNKTRVQINAECRAQKGRTGDWPVAGDTVMCLRNNKNLGLFNGMQGVVKYAYNRPDNKMLFQSNGLDFWVRFDPTQFGKEKYDFSGYREDPDPFDWCEAITAHKSQGDEWDNVMVFEQKSDFWDQRRWSYTAASRARECLLWVAAT
jgi:exodeoxyribonuclease-5